MLMKPPGAGEDEELPKGGHTMACCFAHYQESHEEVDAELWDGVIDPQEYYAVFGEMPEYSGNPLFRPHPPGTPLFPGLPVIRDANGNLLQPQSQQQQQRKQPQKHLGRSVSDYRRQGDRQELAVEARQFCCFAARGGSHG